MSKIIVAAGCFWGVQDYFDKVPGVTKTTTGYTGGHTKNPSYESVCQGATGHAEAVLIEYEPDNLGLILEHFFKMHDPTQLNKQGPDVGLQYRSALYYFDDAQKKIIIAAGIVAQTKMDKPIVTEIAKAGVFYDAENYHQKFTYRTGQGSCPVPYSVM